MPLVVGFVELLGSVLLLTSAVTGASFTDVIKGRAGQIYRTGATTTTTTAPSNAGPTPNLSGSLTSQVNQIAKTKGWDATQVEAWLRVIARESGGSLTAQNPSSPAYGIAQFIGGPSEYATYGGNSTTLTGQLTAMANYIEQRYGTPAAAWAHELNQGNY